MCKISKQSDLAQLIRLCKVIVWDEAPMMNKLTFEAVDRTFRDLMEQVDERNKNVPRKIQRNCQRVNVMLTSLKMR